MLSASAEFKDKIENGNPIFTKVNITLQNGSTVSFNAGNFAFDDGFEMNTATSNSSSFDIGACITGELRLKLLNYNGELDDYSFDKAKVVAYVYSPDLTEEIRKGVFYVDSQDFNSGVVSLICYDKMTAFDKRFDNSTEATKTASQWVTELADSHNISLKSARFNNSTLELKIPTDGDYTEKQILSYILQCTGNYAKIDEDEQLCIDWYEVTNLKPIIDAQTFTNPSEDIIDAGNVENIDDVELIYTGGTFNERKNESSVITRLFAHNIAVDDVEVTGVRTVLEDGTEVLVGKEGYVLRIEKNPLITEENQVDITQRLWNVCIGLTFRPMTISILSNPLIQSGDILMIVIKGNIYYTIATVVDYSQGNYTTITCGAETPTKNSSKYGTPNILIDKKVNGIIDTRLTDYDRGMMELINLISQSLGTYTTKQVLDDGSIIYILHDKPTLADSKKIWKFTANGLIVSNDGGNTWNSGWTSDGKLVMNIIEAVGISFSWAKGGTLTLGGKDNGNGVLIIYDKDGKAIGYWDNTGINTIRGTIGDWTIGTDGLTSDEIKLGGTTYQTWMNVPKTVNSTGGDNKNNTWIYSTVNDEAGNKDMIGSWVVNLLGQMHFGTGNYIKAGVVYGIPFIDNFGTNARVLATLWVDDYGMAVNNNFRIGGNLTVQSSISASSLSVSSFKPSSISTGSVSCSSISCSGEIGNYYNRASQVYSNYLWGETLQVTKTFVCDGTKSRIVDTDNYGTKELYCYETPSPMFGDIGEATLDENGVCYVYTDDVFAETIDNSQYQVFLQAYGDGKCYVADRQQMYFIVKGTPNMAFGWEIKAIQRDYNMVRMETFDKEHENEDILAQQMDYIDSLNIENEALINRISGIFEQPEERNVRYE